MSKSFFKSIVMAAVFVIGAVLPLQASAGQADLDGAVRYYKKTLIDGICHGAKINSGMEISSAKRQQLEQIADKFVNRTLLPFLRKNNMLDEWIKCQNDPEIIRLNDKAMRTSNLNEVQSFMVEALSLMTKKYSGLMNVMTQDPAYMNGFQQLMQEMMTVIVSN